MRANEFTSIEEGLYDPHIFKAVFMAGAPGAGKSTVANMIFQGSGLKSLNVDTFWQLYQAQSKTGDYEKFWDLYKKQEANYLDGRLGLLIDGTARNPEAMAKVKARLEEMGYDCAMVFVNTTLETSLSRTVTRAATPGKDQGREVNADFVNKAWNQVQQGLGKLQMMFGQQFYIVDNNRGKPNVAYVDKAMRTWLAQAPRKPAATEWIKQQKELKAKGPAANATA
jgi:predicted kinase